MAMSGHDDPGIRQDLLTRRSRLEEAAATAGGDGQLARLLREVDAALARLDAGAYGLCEECGDPIEAERLLADPVVRFCIDHLHPDQQAALEEDLRLAAEIQAGLLPPRGLRLAGWETAYLYRAAGVVSGDYCDLLGHDRSMYFVLGDVSGKGVPAAMLMAHLHATMRPLVTQGLPLERIMARASRIFCESTHTNLFATLVCGRAEDDGRVTLSSGGHDPVLVARGGEIRSLGATGLPLGMFCDAQFATTAVQLSAGDSIFLYSDGLSEAVDAAGEEYGLERVTASFAAHRDLPVAAVIAGCLADLEDFRTGAPLRDDLTMMVIRRS
jgi:sigma-B regulation protein RsbU (phosphoserine phosphatase)